MFELDDHLERRADHLVRVTREFLQDLVSMRDQHGLSQQEVADRMGVSQPTVSAFEHYDSNPTLSTIRRYAMAVDARFSIEVIDDYADPVWAEWFRTSSDRAWTSTSDAGTDWSIGAGTTVAAKADV